MRRDAITGGVRQEFGAALDKLVEQVKRDRSVLAAILCGSLSHDTVWEKSDIDLALVTADEKKPANESISLYLDGINTHALLIPRTEFRKMVEGSLRNSFAHSFLAKGRLLYTHDENIARLCDQLQAAGERDRELQLLAAGCRALPAVYKAHKWLVTRGDLEYSALWILYAAAALAKIEVIAAGQLLDREALPQAAKLNPDFFEIVYTGLLNSRKTEKNVRAALEAIDGYLEKKAMVLFGKVIDHLEDVGEARSATEIEDHFRRNYGIEGATAACEYLADVGRIGKAGLPVKLTRKSNIEVEELAFFRSTKAADAR